MIELIRKTFKESGMSMKALSDASGVPYASIHGTVELVSDGSRWFVASPTLRRANVKGP